MTPGDLIDLLAVLRGGLAVKIEAEDFNYAFDRRQFAKVKVTLTLHGETISSDEVLIDLRSDR